jgi:hypothetical protein
MAITPPYSGPAEGGTAVACPAAVAAAEVGLVSGTEAVVVVSGGLHDVNSNAEETSNTKIGHATLHFIFAPLLLVISAHAKVVSFSCTISPPDRISQTCAENSTGWRNASNMTSLGMIMVAI